jgi:mono/diheme cytochrome c family protein
MTSHRGAKALLLPALVALSALSVGTGCRQKMSDQPYYRPLEESSFFTDGRASRPLERGVVHRAQRLDSDPMVTGLTAAEWERGYRFGTAGADMTPDAKGGKDAPTLTDAQRLERAIGAPRYAPGDATKVYAEEYPFQITQADLKRGQERYTIYCAVCHGTLGNGQGKIWERGYLTPTSFHTRKVSPTEIDVKNPQGLGISRGYSLWGHTVPMDEVPVGYIFEVITKGYGGMPSYSAQIPPQDRWRIVAYIRVLQLSLRPDAKLPPEVKNLLDGAGGKK